MAAPPEAMAAMWPDITGEIAAGDFDNDGNVETAVGSPEYACGKGIVYVLDDEAGSVTTWTRDTSGILGTGAACSDHFGADLVAADFNGDGFDDLAVSAPGSDDSGTADAGVVHVLFGSSSGLTAAGDQLFHQDTTGVSDSAESDDDFGSVLEAGDHNCDGFMDLVISVPLESWTVSEAGGVHVLYGSASGITTVEDWWRQGLPGVNGSNEASDHFGSALAAGNFNGDSNAGNDCDDLAIGIAEEDINGATDAGRVYVMYGGASGLSTTGDISIHQDKAGVDDDAEAGDRFAARLQAADLDGDGYDELIVTVPGDGDRCQPTLSDGRHVFDGSSAGLAFANNELGCDLFGCTYDSGVYACLGIHAPVYASSGNDIVRFLSGGDVAYGDDGNDTIFGSTGADILFGALNDDTLDGGPGPDVLIGGAGDDTFIIDLDCEVQPGDVVDGGPGTDTIRSHLSQSQLVAAGLLIGDIEKFVTIAEDPFPEGPEGCGVFPYTTKGVLPPALALSWDDIPTPSTVYTTSTGLLVLTVDNRGDVALDVEVTARLVARGYAAVQTFTQFSLAAQTSTQVTVDLNDFIPAGVDPQQLPPQLLELPTSAVMTAWGRASSAGAEVDTARAPRLYGHLDTTAEEAVVYGEQAMRTTYNNGDLEHLGQVATAATGKMKVYGSRGPLP